MKKYKPGRGITSLDELAAQEFVYWRDKITHREWFLSWQLQMAIGAMQSGIIKTAERATENFKEEIERR